MTEGEFRGGLALDVCGERQQGAIAVGYIDYVGAIADFIEAFENDAAGTNSQQDIRKAAQSVGGIIATTIIIR
jgi:hypothetical protein